MNTPDPVEYFFPKPIITKKLRYTILEAKVTTLQQYCVHLDIIGCNGMCCRVCLQIAIYCLVLVHAVPNTSVPVPVTTDISPQPTITPGCPEPVTVTQQQHCPTPSMVICETPPVVLQATGSSSWMVGVAAGIPLALVAVLLVSILALVAVYWTHRTRR